MSKLFNGSEVQKFTIQIVREPMFALTASPLEGGYWAVNCLGLPGFQMMITPADNEDYLNTISRITDALEVFSGVFEALKTTPRRILYDEDAVTEARLRE